MSLASDSIIEKPFLPSPDTLGKPSTTFHKMNLQITIEIKKKNLYSQNLSMERFKFTLISNVLKFFRPRFILCLIYNYRTGQSFLMSSKCLC